MTELNTCSKMLRLVEPLLSTLKLDLRGCPGDEQAAAIDPAAVRSWWDRRYRLKFRHPSGTARGKGRGQFDAFVGKLGSADKAQSILEYTLDNWDTLRVDWDIDGPPSPGFLLGWRMKLAACRRAGRVLPLMEAEVKAEEVEHGEWA